MKNPIEILLDKVEWTALSPPHTITGRPYATHEGVIDVGGIKLRVYRLNEGQKIIAVIGESHD